MNIFYADDTYAKTVEGDAPRNVHIFGGVLVSRDAEDELIKRIREVKSRYTHQNMPVKWNFKDKAIKEKYQEFSRRDEYLQMLSESRDWRLEIFKKIDDIEYTIITACIENYSQDPKVVKAVKHQLNTYCFENVLMRVGLDAKTSGGKWQCVLDWPPDGDSKPFDRGYYQLFHTGRASSPKPAKCGPLERLGFSHSLHFTRTNHSPMMQLADLVIGATRDHIECQIQGRDSSVGTEAVELFYNHFRNKNGQVPQYGVITSTGNHRLKKSIARIFTGGANSAAAQAR